MSKKLLIGGVVLLVIGILFVVLVQFVIMPSSTGWKDASSEMESASVDSKMWVNGEITSEDETTIFGQSAYSYELENVDDPTIVSTIDLGDKGDSVTVEIEKTSESTYEVRRQASTPPLFWIGIVLAIIGAVLAAVGYIKGGKEELPSSEGPEEF